MPKPFPVSMSARLEAALAALEHWTSAAEELSVTVPLLTVEFRAPGTPAVAADPENGVEAQPAKLGEVIAALEFERDSETGEYGYRTV